MVDAGRTDIGKGMIAGLAATVALSLLMLMKTAMGLMPELDIVGMLSRMMGSPGTPEVGWAAHFVIGVLVFGGLFAMLDPRLPGGTHTVRGIVFGVAAWLMMMVAVMPMAGAGLFGLNLGIMVPILTLVLHVIFGAVLGWTYGGLLHRVGHAHA